MGGAASRAEPTEARDLVSTQDTRLNNQRLEGMASNDRVRTI